MKTLIALSLLSLSTFAFAESCFKAAVPTEYKSQIPEVICVQEYDFELARAQKLADEVNVQTSLGFLKGYSFIKPLEASNEMSASGEFFVDRQDSCGSYLAHTVVVKFLVDSEGKNIADSLKVSVKTESAYDGCHSRMRVETLDFDKI